MIGFAVEVATGTSAEYFIAQVAPPWAGAAASGISVWFPTSAWFGSGESGLAFTMSAAVATLALTGLHRDIARQLPVVATLLLIALTILDIAIVLTSPWEVALALFYSVGVIIGAVSLAAIIAITFSLA